MEQLKHECLHFAQHKCGVALIRLRKPLEYYVSKYGSRCKNTSFTSYFVQRTSIILQISCRKYKIFTNKAGFALDLQDKCHFIVYFVQSTSIEK